MPERSEFAGTTLLRPLLGETRASLEVWAREHQLSWIEDESNQDDGYDRNFLRLRVLPLLSERWPHFADATARSAMLCAEQESLLDELLSDELAELISEDGALAIAPLKAMSPVRRAALLRRWLASHHAAMPSRAMLNRIWDEVATGAGGCFPVRPPERFWRKALQRGTLVGKINAFTDRCGARLAFTCASADIAQ